MVQVPLRSTRLFSPEYRERGMEVRQEYLTLDDQAVLHVDHFCMGEVNVPFVGFYNGMHQGHQVLVVGQHVVDVTSEHELRARVQMFDQSSFAMEGFAHVNLPPHDRIAHVIEEPV